MGVIWCVPGFLGVSRDWDFLPWPHRVVEIFRGERIAAGIEDTIIGYSMGGRLALRGLAERPVRRAVIISAGIDQAGPERRKRDEEWAQRFEAEEWTSVMRAWNEQPVFGGHAVSREESDYERRELARALREWSPAVVEPPRLSEITTPVLWIAGARDPTYINAGERAVAQIPHAELWICPDAGHRVPWEQPAALVDRLRTFLDMH